MYAPSPPRGSRGARLPGRGRLRARRAAPGRGPSRATCTTSSCGPTTCRSGLYVLEAGATDPQGPHTEDEVYYIVSGRGQIRVGDEDRAVTAGSVVFVGADVEHRFHDIEEQLVILVVFGPAEYTHRVDHQRGQPHGAARS